MEKQNNNKYEERLVQIDERIKDLKEHQNMWFKAGGLGGRMIMQSEGEISKLEAEKARILDGTQEKIDQIQEKIEELQVLKEQCNFINFIKKGNLSKEIKGYEEEKGNLLGRR